MFYLYSKCLFSFFFFYFGGGGLLISQCCHFVCYPIKCGSGDKIQQGAPPAEEMTDISDCFIRTSLPLCFGTHGQSSFPINHSILTTDRPNILFRQDRRTRAMIALRTTYSARAVLMSQTNHNASWASCKYFWNNGGKCDWGAETHFRMWKRSWNASFHEAYWGNW